MNGQYEFIAYLQRLNRDFNRYEILIWILNASLISIAIYIIFLLLGLPSFTRFYWQDFLPLAESTSIISAIIGAAAAFQIRKRRPDDFYSHLGPDLSEKAKAAYDNRRTSTLPMQSLAEELRINLSTVRSSQIIEWRRVQLRLGIAAFLLVSAVFIVQSQIGADISPSDFQSISDLKDKAIGFFQNDTEMQNPPRVNLSGNIYGKPSLAVLNEVKLEIQLYPGTAPGSRAAKSDPLDHHFQQSEPGEVSVVPTELYIESLPAENREIIKRYFEALAKG